MSKDQYFGVRENTMERHDFDKGMNIYAHN